VNIAATGNAIYSALKDDAAAVAKVRAELKTLALAITTDPASVATVTSATVNGQSFTAQPTITTGQRLALLRWVVRCFDAGTAISSTQISTF